MSNVKSLIAGVLVLPVLASGAAPAGQVEGGDIYRVKNVTKNSTFADPATADVCETVQFRVRIHNPGPDALTGVKVKATLNTEASASHSSTVTVSADNANPATTTDTAGVNLSKAAGMTYVAGSTELLDANGAKMSTLADGILNSGVTVTNGVGVSTEQKRFVQFSAKVDCPTTPTTPKTPTTPAAPVELPHTGASDVVAAVAGATFVGAIAHRLFTSRRLAK
jgi:uncharacterized repeat protein (TIGR01451 family)